MGRRSQRHKQEIQGVTLVAGVVVSAWAAGANTTLSVTSTRARCTRNGAGDPLIVVTLTNLISGANYRIDTTHFLGTAAKTATYKIDTAPTLPTGSLGTFAISANGPVSMNFTAPSGGPFYFGFSLATTANGDYAETSLKPTVTKL